MTSIPDADWVNELAVPIHFGQEVTEFMQNEEAVEATLADGQSLRVQYLVGCDGGRSVIRKAAGIDLPGWDATVSNLIAEVEMTGCRNWASTKMPSVSILLARRTTKSVTAR